MANEIPGATGEQADAHKTNGHGLSRSSASERQKQAKPEEGRREYQVETDCYVHRFIVKVLGGVVAIALVGSLGLVIAERPIPDIFLAFGSGALGALAGLLAPPPSRQNGNSP
jgi:hypothetical protein